MASHGLLLRFLSSFFSVDAALHYLQLYPDNIGVTWYITQRLSQLDPAQLAEAWGFVCHLLITRPSRSRALECFVVDMSRRSSHIAMITLWFMQAALKDILSTSKSGSQAFQICQRTLHNIHEVIFSDLPRPSSSPYSSLQLPFHSRFRRRKINPQCEPAVVGLGMVAVGVVLPSLTGMMGQVAIEQGRADEDGARFRSIESADNLAPALTPSESRTSIEDDDEDEADDHDANVESPPPSANSRNTFPDSQSLSVSASQTVPALPLHIQGVRRSRMSTDPLGQLDLNDAPSTPYQSSPSISSARPPLRSSSFNVAESLLQKYDGQSQIHLLRSHYCRSEVQFLISLENISNRLLVVPRPARVSALRAELTALNHKLPAEVCMPMWCSSSDKLPKSGSIPEPHHRIVRIPPGESVVLNSAERAPYLLLIEILSDDLDFDPQKRANKEVLKKIVVREAEREGGSKDLINFTATSPLPKQKLKPERLMLDDLEVDGSPLQTPLPGPSARPKDSPPVSASIGDNEEMDLVEQLYGENPSLRTNTADLSESIMLPLRPKNKELEMAAWSRTNSAFPSPIVNNPNSSHLNPTFPPNPKTPLTASLASPASARPGANAELGHTISLEEYSERMRTAAIMLAQLNANLGRDSAISTTITAISSYSSTERLASGPLSWVPGSNWLSSALTIEPPPQSPSSPKPQGPLHPSLQGTRKEGQHMAPAKMRLDATEAAAIRDRIMKEMLSLEEERMERMRDYRFSRGGMRMSDSKGSNTVEDEGIIRRELDKEDPSAAVFSESWSAKKSRIRHESPYGHLANWDCISVIVKTGGDLRQEQLAVQLILEFQRIWQEEQCQCWVRYFRILILGGSSGLVETINDAVSIHSIKKAEYAKRLASGGLGHVTLLDHFKATYGDPSSAKYVRAQRNFVKSLAGYSVVTFLLQIKDRHNGNILLDRDGHLIHIDFGFILSNSPGNIGFEAAPFKLSPEYVDVLGGVDSPAFQEFRTLFREGFEAARKHCDRIITLVELMQKDSTLPCFATFGDQTANQLRDRFQPTLTHNLVGEYVDRLVDSSLFSNWTRLYDSFQYYSQSIL